METCVISHTVAIERSLVVNRRKSIDTLNWSQISHVKSVSIH
jgi:hypothetical protein